MAVTALRGSGQLLDVKVAQLTARGLHDAPAVRPGVVRVALAQSQPLSHLGNALVQILRRFVLDHMEHVVFNHR